MSTTQLDGNGPERRGPRKHTLTFLLPSDLYSASHWLNSMRSQRAREPIDAVQGGQRANHRAWDRGWRIDMGWGTKDICWKEGQIVQ